MPHPKTASAASRGRPAVAVVGAGVAGLTAAVALLDAGIVPTLFEAADHVGGRTHSTDEPWLGAHRTEWCAELVNSDHATMLAHIRRLGIPTRDRERVVPELGELCLLSGESYATADALRDYDAGVRAVVEAQAAAIGMPASWTPAGEAARALDALSVHEWIERHVPGGHDSRLGTLIDLGYTIECGVDSRRQSAINLVRQLAGLAPGTFGVLGTSDERYRVLGGIDQVPRGLARLLPAEALRLNAQLVRIARGANDRAVLGLSVDGERQEAVFDHAILTLPYTALRQVDLADAALDERKAAAIREFGYGAHSKLQLEFAGRPWSAAAEPHRCNGTTFTDLDLGATWESTLGDDGETSVLVSYLGGPLAAAAQIAQPYASNAEPQVARRAQQIVAQLDRLWPGAAEAFTGRATLTSPTSDPFLGASYSCRLVGQHTGFDGRERTPEGPFHFAGEQLSPQFQRFMEGAASEGMRAAREVLEAVA
ncbi:flavin monoamine oxidase family protein [Conexibacter woesei]|uniref:flavin monoamine oxidase family protein n=1 Tax=Conexibacter woesei TaxID=191495 RepID=UPI0002FA031D|nr:NAD(P)/FAD-dependent oxidoreductase [Conexibacter woesei]